MDLDRWRLDIVRNFYDLHSVDTRSALVLAGGRWCNLKVVFCQAQNVRLWFFFVFLWIVLLDAAYFINVFSRNYYIGYTVVCQIYTNITETT